MPYCGGQPGFLIKSHGVLCEVRTEGNVDLLVFRALLSLVPHALSYFPDTRQLATIKNHALLGSLIVRFLQTLLRKKSSYIPLQIWWQSHPYINLDCLYEAHSCSGTSRVAQWWHTVALLTFLSSQWIV